MSIKNQFLFWSIVACLFSSCQGDINQSEKVVLDKVLGEIALQNQEGKSQAYLNNLIEKEGEDNAQNYYQRARIYLSEGAYSEAMKDIEKAIKESPNEGKFYFVLAQLFYKKGEYKKAYESIRKSEAFGYCHPDQFMIDGIGSYMKGDKETALKFLKLSEMLHDSDSTTYLYLGRIYQEKGDTTQAMPLFRKAASFQSLKSEAYGSMLHSYNELNKPHKTLKLTADLKKEAMLSSELLCLETAKAYQMIGLKDSAYLWYRRANALVPNAWEAQKELGEYFFQTKDIDKAAEMFTYTTKTNSEKALPYYRLGLIEEFYKSNLDSASTLFGLAVQRDSMDTDIQRSLQRVNKKIAQRDYFKNNPEALARLRAKQKAKKDSINKAEAVKTIQE